MPRFRISLLFLVVLFSACLFVQSGLGQEELDESTTYQITVYDDGSACWVIERRFILSNQEEVTIFENYISEFETQKQTYLEDFSNETEILV